MSIIIAIDCSNCFILLLSSECRIYYAIASVTHVKTNRVWIPKTIVVISVG